MTDIPRIGKNLTERARLGDRQTFLIEWVKNPHDAASAGELKLFCRSVRCLCERCICEMLKPVVFKFSIKAC